MRCVIFDLDGTLVDSAADMIAAANVCFGAMDLGSPLDAIADAATAFRGGRALLRLGFARSAAPWGESDVDGQYHRFLDAYGGAIDVHTLVYPGAREAVEAIRAAGFRTGICTNKPEGLAELLTARLGIRGLFHSLVGADTLPVRKPDPATLREAVRRAGGDIERTVLIGDTVTDRRTATAAGVPSIMVTFGPDGDRVADLKPHGLLRRFEDLPDLVAALIGGASRGARG